MLMSCAGRWRSYADVIFGKGVVILTSCFGGEGVVTLTSCAWVRVQLC